MKKSKILVPAVALLALSTAAATTGTVAWFTTNRTVTATGLSAAIASSQDLRISDSLNPSYAWTTTLGWSVTKSNLVPVTPIAGSLTSTTAVLKDTSGATITADPVFIQPNGSNTITADNGEAAQPVKATGDNSDYYQTISADTAYVTEDFALKYEGSKVDGDSVVLTETVKGTVKFRGAGREIDKAVRLGVYEITDSKFVVYDVTASTGTEYTVTLNNITLTSGEPKEYRIFIYYEGQDAACKNANAVTNPLVVDFSFSLA